MGVFFPYLPIINIRNVQVIKVSPPDKENGVKLLIQFFIYRPLSDFLKMATPL